jgi:hypothetical protein
MIQKLRQRAHAGLIGHIPKYDKLQAFGCRVPVTGSSFVFYVVRGHIIEIHRVIHDTRHLDEIV